ncbi:MAG TPA: shikimate dehydrogenase [Gammaproteobacteria bacterium]|nr:shikimate dehydrogenase [Gammaproteobacteria bacterium]
MSGSACELCKEDCYAVMGNPIAHSKSPLIHHLFAEQTGQRITYDALCVDTEIFAQAVAAFLIGGGSGLNVTVPFKAEAWEIADELSERARRAGAVNTLMIREDGSLFGDNTDGIGLVRDLTQNLGIALEGRSILLLGAGGAARGVLAPLLEQKPARLVIANRTPGRARELAEEFADLGNVSGCGFDELRGQRFDLVINATSAGLEDQVPPLPEGVIGPQSSCYDLMYGDEPTAFVRHARAQGAAHAFDGLGMLVEQAAESFRIWRGVMPETAPVIDKLRASA